MTMESSEDGNIVATLWSVAFVGALLTLISPLLFGVGSVVSTGLGGALAVGNLWSIGKLVRGLLGNSARRLSWGPLGMLKLAGLFLLLYIVVQRGLAQVLPLGFGYLALPIGVVLSQLRTTTPARGEG